MPRNQIFVVQGTDATAIVKKGNKNDPQPRVVIKYRGIGSGNKKKKVVS